jgi:hypothetical protein
MMMPRVPPVIAPPPVLRQTGKLYPDLLLVFVPLDLDTCPAPSCSRRFCSATDKMSPLDFDIQTKKPSRWFWGSNHQTRAASFEAQTEKPSSLILRPNQETHAHRLLMHSANRTQRQQASRSSGHRVLDLCMIISDPLHQVSYSCLDSHRCLPCHLHITRQVNVILHTR